MNSRCIVPWRDSCVTWYQVQIQHNIFGFHPKEFKNKLAKGVTNGAGTSYYVEYLRYPRFLVEFVLLGL